MVTAILGGKKTINNNKNNNKTHSKYYHPNRSAKIRPGRRRYKIHKLDIYFDTMLLKRKSFEYQSQRLMSLRRWNFALSPRRLAIFLVMSSGVLQTYFFLCNGFLIQKVQRVKVISDKRQSHGHSRTHLHVKNTAESMTWAHSFRAAQEFRLNWCNSREDATPLQYCTFPISVKSSKTHFTSPPKVRAWDIHTQECISFLSTGDASNEYPPALSGFYAEKMENASMNSE